MLLPRLCRSSRTLSRKPFPLEVQVTKFTRIFTMASQDDSKSNILDAVRPAVDDALEELFARSPVKALNELGKRLESRSLNQGAEPQLKLHGAANLCPNTWRVEAYLRHFQIPFTPVNVDIMNGEQKRPEFLKLNPQGFVPVLEDQVNGVTVIESGALLLYLDSVWGQGVGKPCDPAELAKMFELLYRVVAGLRNFETRVVLHGAELDEQRIPPLLAEYRFLEQELGAKRYLASEAMPSLVDFLVLPNLFVSRISGLDLEARFPLLNAWVERMLALPGVREGNLVPGWQRAIKEKQGLDWEQRRNP